MILKTHHSIYEVDPFGKRIRRLAGEIDPTPRQGNDGIWKSYSAITDLRIGQGLVIVWEFADEKNEIIARSTITSPIIDIISNQ